ncbi:EamA family transporter [Psychrobacter sp. I-STPA10]|uniref:EamA family transporter n=1 Tax=Psychrobacter sp. I-STPA10 TaxID=2585769 RepID=UPI001E340CBE|nr:EamA family transporter [Psychrobacter sp. I-STPA10]
MKFKEHILAVLVVLIWGFNFVVIRWGIEDLHPLTMTLLRFLLTAIPMIFFIKKPDVAMRYVVIYGVLFGAGVWGLVNWAVFIGMPAGLASLLLQLSPFLTVLAAVVVFKEKLRLTQIVGIVTAFIGFLVICIIKTNTNNVNGNAVGYVGMILMFLAAFFWTICNIIIKIAKPKDVLSFTVWSSLFVPLPILLFTLLYGMINNSISGTAHSIVLDTFLQLPSIKGWVSVLFQAFITTLFGYSVWTQLIGQCGLARVAPYSLLVPISGLFFGWILYDETLSVFELAGSLLVLIGLLLLTVNFAIKQPLTTKV